MRRIEAVERLVIIGTLFGVFRMLVGGISVVYLVHKGFAEREISMLKLVQFACILLSDIPLSYISDRYSKKLSILLAFFCASLWLFITGFFNAKALLYVGEVFNALSLTLFGGAFIAHLINSYKQECIRTGKPAADTKFIIAKFSSSSMLGMVIGVGIAALLPFAFSKLPLHLAAEDFTPLWLTGALLCFALFLFGIKFIPAQQRQQVTQHINFKEQLQTDFIYFTKLLSNKNVIFIFLGAALVDAFFNIVVNYSQIVAYTNFPYLREAHAGASFWFSIFFMAILFVQSLAARLLQKNANAKYTGSIWTSSTLLLLFVLLLGSSATVFTHSTAHSIANIALWLAMFFCLGLARIVYSAQFHNVVSDEMRATSDAVCSTAAMIFSAIMSALLYVCYTALPSFFIFATVVFILLLLCALAAFRNSQIKKIIQH